MVCHNGNLIVQKKRGGEKFDAVIVSPFNFLAFKRRGEFDKFGTTGTAEIPRINERQKRTAANA